MTLDSASLRGAIVAPGRWGAREMRGVIQAISPDGTYGQLAADDGQRYSYWTSEVRNGHPHVGHHVDFQMWEGQPVELFILANPAHHGDPPQQPPRPAAVQPQRNIAPGGPAGYSGAPTGYAGAPAGYAAAPAGYSAAPAGYASARAGYSAAPAGHASAPAAYATAPAGYGAAAPGGYGAGGTFPPSHYWIKLFTSPSGRISRRQFWLHGIVPIIVASVVLGWIPVIGQILSLAFLWGSICIGFKRFHDLGYPGWWSLVYLIPAFAAVVLMVLGLVIPTLLGLTWLLAEILSGVSLLIALAQLFLVYIHVGQQGPNRYGPDPLAAT